MGFKKFPKVVIKLKERIKANVVSTSQEVFGRLSKCLSARLNKCVHCDCKREEMKSCLDCVDQLPYGGFFYGKILKL